MVGCPSSIGAQLAGYEVLGGVDAETAAVEIYSRIFRGKHALHQDVLHESPRRILKKAGISRGDVDVLVGGPPCQPYSVNNHLRGIHDARCALVNSYLELFRSFGPSGL
jgi:DNA (cytosine-5)-methyltransferase 1